MTPETSRRALLQKEIRRKAFHLLSLLFLGAYLLLGPSLTLRLMSLWVMIIFAVETARLRTARGRRFVESIFGPLIRSKEAHRYTGAFYTSLGALTCFFFFGENPAVIKGALLYLAIGDATTALVGRAWGHHPFKILGETRSLEGCSAGFLVAVLCGLGLGFHPIGVAAGALAFSTADAVPLPPDDNFWIPVITGTALYLAGV